MPEILIFIAPVFQIILSILRINRFITIPLSLISAVTILLGFVLSYIAMGVILDKMTRLGRHCGMPGMAILFTRIFITLLTSPLISFIFYFINKALKRNEIAIK